MGNDLVVGMNDFDNGYEITSSAVVVADLAGTRQTISPAVLVATYPSASADGTKVTFTTTAGELYVINIK